MKFSALNVDFNSVSFDTIGWVLRTGTRNLRTPLKHIIVCYTLIPEVEALSIDAVARKNCLHLVCYAAVFSPDWNY